MSAPHFFYVTRLFSGLYESLASGDWKPTGIPTVVRMVEALSAKHAFTWVIACRNEKESAVVGNAPARFTFGTLDIHVLPFRRLCGSGKVNLFYNDMVCIARCLRLSRGAACPVFYCDRSNVVTGGFMKRVMRRPAVIRILGVYPDQKLLAERLFYKLLSPLTFAMYKAPFDLAVCTQDGSGVEFFVDRLLNRKTPRELLLNGVEMDADIVPRAPEGRLAILYVGKLSEEKGVLDLVEAAARLKEVAPDFVVTILGKGPLQPAIEARIKADGLENHVRLAGSVPLATVREIQRQSDVYVSLNRFGNLSNTVLEAMAAGKCCVVLGRDEATHTDVYTDGAVPDGVVVRIDRRDVVGNLTARLRELVEDRARVTAHARNMIAFRSSFLWSWEERTRHETDRLLAVARQACGGGRAHGGAASSGREG
ncbi:MAG: glycosyltransferase family 4 protein [Desulfovibrionaceae bacterium]